MMKVKELFQRLVYIITRDVAMLRQYYDIKKFLWHYTTIIILRDEPSFVLQVLSH